MMQQPKSVVPNIDSVTGLQTFRFNGIETGQDLERESVPGMRSIEVINNTDNYVLVAFEQSASVQTVEARYDLVVPAFNHVISPCEADGFAVLLQGAGNAQGTVNQVIVRTAGVTRQSLTAQLPAASQSASSSTVTVANTVSVQNAAGGTLQTAVPGGVTANIPGNVSVVNPSGSNLGVSVPGQVSTQNQQIALDSYTAAVGGTTTVSVPVTSDINSMVVHFGTPANVTGFSVTGNVTGLLTSGQLPGSSPFLVVPLNSAYDTAVSVAVTVNATGPVDVHLIGRRDSLASAIASYGNSAIDTNVNNTINANVPGNVSIQNPSGVVGLPILHGINAAQTAFQESTGYQFAFTYLQPFAGQLAMTWLYGMMASVYVPLGTSITAVFGLQGYTSGTYVWIGELFGGDSASSTNRFVNGSVQLPFPYHMATIMPNDTLFLPTMALASDNGVPANYWLDITYT